MLTGLNKFVQRACTIQRVASDKERNITLPPIDDLDVFHDVAVQIVAPP
jgi:hypothetical protein